ncbi:glycosyltransferase family 39 protein [Candidatus Woesearchaeota archaeon]|nr:glycosyltransferase family 39 protein [Candidatus Woesearchaeota archaeon]
MKKEFFKDKYNLALLLIILLAFIIRIKYFNINTGLWWDEAEYLNTAKHWVFKIPLDLNPQRPPLFSLLIAFLYMLKANEAVIRFILVLIPSFLTVLFTYLTGKLLYDRKIALIASFIMSIFWLLIFNTTRVHTDALALFFYVLAIYLFFRYYVKEYKKKYIWLIGPILALSFLTRLASILVIISILLYLLFTERLNFLKKKDLWISAFLGTILILLYFIWNKIVFGSFLAFAKSYAQGFAGGPAWYILNFFKLYTEWFYFIFFLLGLLTFYKLFIGFDLLLKNKEESLKSDFFILLWILIPLIYFIFFQRAAEDRWLMIIAPAIFLLIGKGCMLIYNFIHKYNKYIAIIAIAIILSYGAYLQVDHTKKLINEKKDTYHQVRLAGQWIKENSQPTESVLANNVYMELLYSSERKIIDIGTEEGIKEKIKKNEPKYYVVTAFYQSEAWTYEFPSKYPEVVKPVQAYFFDKEQQNLAVIIYEFLKYDF